MNTNIITPNTFIAPDVELIARVLYGLTPNEEQFVTALVCVLISRAMLREAMGIKTESSN